MPKSRTKNRPDLQANWTPTPLRALYEAEVVTGLKPYALAELQEQFGTKVSIRDKDKAEELPFEYDGNPFHLLQLSKTLAVYSVGHYPIPRPLALLGHQHFQAVLRQISAVRSIYPEGRFKTFRISAAGAQSSVFQRIRDEIAQATGLIYNDDEADLMLRVRKADIHPDGWEVLARLSPKPISARAWRVCDMEGALNATIASAMVAMTQPQPEDRVLNIMCGSGTLMIERLAAGPLAVLGGCDTDPMALRCAAENLQASGHSDEFDLFEMDATNLQLPDACLDVLLGDLPWGQLVGSHEGNIRLYPLVLLEAARVAAPGARAAFITHEIRLMEKVLGEMEHLWRLQDNIRVFQGGLHPRIYLLERV